MNPAGSCQVNPATAPVPTATAFQSVPKADTIIEAGDEVLLVLDPGLEEAITAYFAPNAHSFEV